MGKGKLTLSVEKALVEEAKIYAREAGKSLSEIVEEYLEFLVFTNWCDSIARELGLDKLEPPQDPFEIPRSRPKGLDAAEIVRELRKRRTGAILGDSE